MKTIASIALALTCASVMAQSNAPTDVPKDHWAYPAVTNLYRLGILKGYPDGTFKGSRPATRFEMATALDAAVLDLKKITEDLKAQLEAKKTGPYQGQATYKPEGQQLRDALQALQIEVGSLRATKSEVNALNDDFAAMNEQLRSIRANLTEMRSKLDKTKN